MSKITPMMKQYLDIKEKYQDAILFYRLGDFYEMFFDDAIASSKILEIALTARNYSDNEKAPMCGVPFHSANSYIQKLISEGKRVAICEQVEDPKMVKGIVKREVVKVISPGTNVEDNNLDGYKNVYLMSITFDDNFNVSYIDLSEGEITVTTLKQNELLDFIYQIYPKEIIISSIDINNIKSINPRLISDVKSDITITIKDIFSNEIDIQNVDLSFLNIEQRNSVEFLLNYINETQGLISNNINKINIYEKNDFLIIDQNTRKNLELLENANTKQKKNSLFDVLDYTSTSIGKRTLKKWIDRPLKSISQIESRLDLIDEFNIDYGFRTNIEELLKEIYDLERICSKITYGNITSKDLVALRSSILIIPILKEKIMSSNFVNLKNIASNIDDLIDVSNLLSEAIVDNPAISIKDGEVISSEYNKELKEYRFLEKNTSNILRDIESKAKTETGIKNLKLGYNKIFGYYFEATKTALKDVTIPENYFRKQTLANAERYINTELKETEDKILQARQKIYDIQMYIFEEIKSVLNSNISRISYTSRIIGELDALLSLSFASIDLRFTRPKFNNESKFEVKASRHPVVEKIIGEDNFVPNDILVDDSSKIQIITGPNMGGKSTYMRQTAIIAIMAHMGSFVPAKEVNIPILDAVFTRVGASDDLSLGQSTFMVEMNEVSYILKNATKNSLIILDEVGRGTSTFDGMSIAWAIIEYISKNINSITLFSTHYHEITELEKKYKNVKNFFIAVDEVGNDIKFMHKIMEGKMDKSYGIHVAKIAGLPFDVLARAEKKLFELENSNNSKEKTKINVVKNQNQLSIEDLKEKYIINELKDINLDDISPRQAYSIIEKLQEEIIKKDKKWE